MFAWKDGWWNVRKLIGKMYFKPDMESSFKLYTTFRGVCLQKKGEFKRIIQNFKFEGILSVTRCNDKIGARL